MKLTLKRILRYIGRYKILLVLSVFLAAVTVALSLYLPTAFGSAIDSIVGFGNVDHNGLIKSLVVAAVVIAVCALLQWVMNVINNALTFGVAKDIRRDAASKLGALPLSYIDAHPEGETVSRVITDVDQFTDGLLMGFTQFFTGVITIVGTIGFMLRVDWRIAIAVIVLTPMSLFIAKFVSANTYKMFALQAKTRGEQTAFAKEMIENQKVVRRFGREDENIRIFDEVNERLRDCTLKAVFFSSLVNPSTRFVNNIIYAAVALAGSLVIVGNVGGITVGGLSCLLAYATQYAKPFNEISGVITELQSSIACAERVFELLDTESETPDGNVIPEVIKGNIRFDNVSFSYNENASLIENLNLEIKAGQRVAIVGPTGCGKTTLINLLMRFYDVDEGQILIDGVNIKDIPRKVLRSSFGMVLQDTYLFKATVFENIAYGKEDATNEEIEAAARAARSKGFIGRLPAGFDTVIGEGAAQLSQGQKQLLAISRIMKGFPPMLILDEATSSIDTRTEMIIQEAFARLTEGRTSFIVAHRLSTIRNADVILYMENGSVKEKGTHTELLALDGGYAKLYNSQFN
ncbi:MAG: ABC transporter ATP-binding protein [Clostridia bacterium]|nr:ABC transporter ATP-binding protein [Clostridia bacterium]